MKIIVISFISFLSLNIFSGCDKDGFEDVLCYEFDQRQCAGDEWSDMILINETESVREAKMKDYLESKNIEVKKVKLVKGFHEGVCEACNVCPETDRFFVQFNKEDLTDFQSLDLLSFAEIKCGDQF